MVRCGRREIGLYSAIRTWFEIDIYYKPFINEKQKIEFIQSMTRDELTRFYAGATLEGLNWYREKRREYSTDWQMCSEFPSTADEAFQTTGRRRMTRCMSASSGPLSGNPLYVGELLADATYGPEALQNLHFVPTAPEIFTFGSCLIPRGVSPTAMRWRSTLAGAVPMPTGVLFRYSTVSP